MAFVLATGGWASAAEPTRVVVKVRPFLASHFQAALPDATLVVGDPGAAPELVRLFMVRHDIRTLRPAFPGIVSRLRATGHTEGDLVQQTRQRFAVRAARSARPVAPVLARTFVVEVTAVSAADLSTRISSLASDPDVEYAEAVGTISIELVPDDPFFSSSGSWGQAYDDLWGLKAISCPTAWDSSTGQGVVVAVVDTGVDASHVDLAANAWTNAGEVAANGVDDDGNGFVDDDRGWDFVGPSYAAPIPDNDPRDEHGHGTHVAGTVAAVGNDATGVLGVAWQAHVMAVRGLDKNGSGSTVDLANALVYAADNGADVINVSWGGTERSQVLADAVSHARSLGTVVVAAAGNNAGDASTFFPAALPEVIAVAALSPGGTTLASFSNRGSRIDVSAPGEDILSLRAAGTAMGTAVGTGYTRANGTSMAAPHASGVAALVLGGHPGFSTEQVRQALRSSAHDLGADAGYGRIDAPAALAVVDPLEARILTPTTGSTFCATTPVSGVAQGPDFAQYTLDYGAGAAPSSWVVLASSGTPVADGTLGSFDAPALPDGLYTIRLRATSTAATTFTDRIRVNVECAAIHRPAPPAVPSVAEVFKPGVVLAIDGTAQGATFQHYVLEWAPGEDPTTGWRSDGMSLENGGTQPVIGGRLGMWTTPVAVAAGSFTIRVRVQNDGSVSEGRTTVYLEPDLLGAGWPRWLDVYTNPLAGVALRRKADGERRLVLTSSYWGPSLPSRLWSFSVDGMSLTQVPFTHATADRHPAVGDLDGAPGDELLVADRYAVHVYGADGTERTISLPAPWGPVDISGGTITLSDLDRDGRPDVLAVGVGPTWEEPGYVLHAWHGEGTPFRSPFPLSIADEGRNQGSSPQPPVLVADLDADGKTDLLVLDAQWTNTVRIRRLDGEGRNQSYAGPTLGQRVLALAAGDLDGDGTMSTVVLSCPDADAHVHVLTPTGQEQAGWPRRVGPCGGRLALGDLDGDGTLEVVTAAGSEIHVRKGSGATFSSAWPRIETNPWGVSPTFGPVALADVDGQPGLEIVTTRARYVSTGAGHQANDLLAFRADGTLSRTWVLHGAHGNQPWRSGQPEIGDFDGDGQTDIALTTATIDGGGVNGWIKEGVLTVLAMGVPHAPGPREWPSALHDKANTSVVPRDYAVLLVKRSGDGVITSDPPGIECGTVCKATFPWNTVVTLSAQPTGTLPFTGWSGACTGTGSCVMSLDSDRTVAGGFIGVSVSDATVDPEPDSGTTNASFTVRLSSIPQHTVTVDYATTPGTATSKDFTAKSGTLRFLPGTSRQTVAVKVKGDLLDEADQVFAVDLGSAIGATVVVGHAVGTIVDNDPPPTISVSDVTIAEAESSVVAKVSVHLSAGSDKGASVTWATSDGSARAGKDYVARTGTLQWLPGTTGLTRTISVTIKADAVAETAENFFVDLSAPTNATLGDVQAEVTILEETVP